MLASGLGVYRFVTIGEISREQHQLVRPPTVPEQCSGTLLGKGQEFNADFHWEALT
jgi:hypothetical protein